jgi:hypothetical protein
MSTHTLGAISFRLPRPGERDPHFGLPRAKYYQLEAEGRLRLLRLRDKNKARGTTLVLVAEMMRVLEEDFQSGAAAPAEKSRRQQKPPAANQNPNKGTESTA